MDVLKRKVRRVRATERRPAQTFRPVTEGMRLTFRAEVMPGRDANERTYTVARVLTGGRVELSGLHGEHALREFAAAKL